MFFNTNENHILLKYGSSIHVCINIAYTRRRVTNNSNNIILILFFSPTLNTLLFI